MKRSCFHTVFFILLLIIVRISYYLMNELKEVSPNLIREIHIIQTSFQQNTENYTTVLFKLMIDLEYDV